MREDIVTKTTEMAKDIIFLKDEVKEIKQLLKDHINEEAAIWNRIDNKLQEKLEMKANVWVEDAFRYALYTVAGILILALLSLVIIKTGSLVNPL